MAFHPTLLFLPFFSWFLGAFSHHTFFTCRGDGPWAVHMPIAGGPNGRPHLAAEYCQRGDFVFLHDATGDSFRWLRLQWGKQAFFGRQEGAACVKSMKRLLRQSESTFSLWALQTVGRCLFIENGRGRKKKRKKRRNQWNNVRLNASRAFRNLRSDA